MNATNQHLFACICVAAMAISFSAASSAQTFDGYKLVWSEGDMAQGGHGIGWLTGDINGNGKAEFFQPWDNGGTLGLLVYEWADAETGYTKIFGSSDMRQGAGALAWLTGDVNGDGKDELVQPWNNGGQLGLIVYEWKDNGVSVACGSANMREGSPALAWMLADINGDGKDELIQPWGDPLGFGPLGLLVYGWDGQCFKKIFGSTNMGETAGALAWLTGDVNGDGKDEIVQPWPNGGQLGLKVYEWKDNVVSLACKNPNMREGSPALAWMLADANGDGKDDLIQPWNSGGSLGLLVYGWNGQCFSKIFGSTNMGEGSPAAAWLTGDVDGNGTQEILQPFANGNSLGLIVYGWKHDAYTVLWGSPRVSANMTRNGIYAADTLGDGKTDLTLADWLLLTGRDKCEPRIGPICRDYCWCDGLSLYVLTPQFNP